MSPINQSQQGNTLKNPETVSADNFKSHSLNLESQSLNHAQASPGWKKEQYQVLLRGIGLATSIISLTVMVRNNYGYTLFGLIEYSNNFGDYTAYRYLLSAAIISVVYNMYQLLRQFRKGNPMFTKQTLSLLDLIGDLIVSYLLVSAGSTALQITINLNNSGVTYNSFTDSSFVSLSVALLAFLAMALSTIISAYKLSS